MLTEQQAQRPIAAPVVALSVIHVAGPLDPDQIQRCARCGQPLKDFRRNCFSLVAWGGGVVYPVGAKVEIGRNWQAMLVSQTPPNCEDI